ncbi:MAG TPA: hypothetical protein VEN30_30385 [Paraburkholderia sp.]|nr:hypothetical protein [Paraburkholderia sp.]
MRTVKIVAEPREAFDSRFVSALKGNAQGEFISFESAAALLETLTPDRWEILTMLAGRGAMLVVDVQELVGRSLKEVCADFRLLVERGIVDEDSHGCVVFPYDRVEVDFVWSRNV